MPRSVAAHQSLQRTTWTPWVKERRPATRTLRGWRCSCCRRSPPSANARNTAGCSVPLCDVGFKGDLATPYPRRDLFIFGPTPRRDANWGLGSPARRTRCSWRAIRTAVPRGCRKNSVRRYMRARAALRGSRRHISNSRSSAPRASLIDAALPASECGHSEVARADPNRPQSLSARASLYARARPKVVREASRQVEV